MTNAIERIETLAKIQELFPSIGSERAMEIADWATGNVVLDPERLRRAVDTIEYARIGLQYGAAYVAVSKAIESYLSSETA